MIISQFPFVTTIDQGMPCIMLVQRSQFTLVMFVAMFANLPCLHISRMSRHLGSTIMSSYTGPKGPPRGKELGSRSRSPSAPDRPSSSAGSNSVSGLSGRTGEPQYSRRKKPSVSNPNVDGVRINKCLSTLSRRSADDAITEGRVTVNGKVATSGQRVNPGDKVTLDGKLQRW